MTAGFVPARWAPPQPTPLDPRPVRVDRRRRGAPHTVCVAVPSEWAGGACAAPTAQLRAAALADYAVRLAGRPDLLARIRSEMRGRDVGCHCDDGLPCHRDILIDLADPRTDPYAPGGHALAVTVARPWASLTLLPEQLCPTVVHHRSWSTDYRGVLCIAAARRIDEHRVASVAAAGFDADFHTSQTGWLGAAVLVDVHPARNCCAPWGRPARRGARLYHWVFRHGARLARPVFGHGFTGVRAVSWTVLVRPPELGLATSPGHNSGAGQREQQ